MNITMIDTNTHTETLDTFLNGSADIVFTTTSKKEVYGWMNGVLDRLHFRQLSKKGRGTVREYIQKMTGYSNAHMSRLIGKYFKGMLKIVPYRRNRFRCKYIPSDIALLCKTDNAHVRLNGGATQEILRREYTKFNHAEYENISQISLAHLYRLRSSRIYRSKSLTFKNTNAVQRNIGERRKPDPQGCPGYIRIDTVHQGDIASEHGHQGEKGVYHINSVDEVTQWEIVASVEKISEAYLAPILRLIIAQYPFVIREFHTDNGSEYINRTVVKLLNILLIRLTKSRSRRTNDNALVESKNGSIIRKHMGYFYINQKYAPDINDFYQVYFNTYLNFHRPCGFATNTTNTHGKIKKIYNIYKTPFVAFKDIKDARGFLKPGITMESLEKIAGQKSDNEYAHIVGQQKQLLFDRIGLKPIDV